MNEAICSIIGNSDNSVAAQDSDARFDAKLRTIEEEHQMPTLPPRQVRLIARNRQEAELEGEIQTLRAVIIETLEVRFGSVPTEISEYLFKNEAVPRLKALFSRALQATSIEDIRAQLN